MTREETIKLIDTHTVCFYNEIDSPTLQALHLAIEALQSTMSQERVNHEPTNDLISRAEVLRIIITAGEVEPDLGYTHLHDVIEALPSADRPSNADKDGMDMEQAKEYCKECTHNEVCRFYPYDGCQFKDTDRPQGEWKPIDLNGYPYVTCDQCGMLADMVQSDNGTLVMSMAIADETYANYCPKCGAKMKGGEDE